jgi:putative restriction endonuclease
MAKRVNHEERAARAWPVLVKIAADSATITYGQLAKAIGIHHRPLRYVLGRLQDHCIEEELPPLTILVVRGGDRRPGTGFIGWEAELDDRRALVHAFDWSSLPNPFEYAIDGPSYEELVNRVLEDPSNAADVYQLVKVRGVRQRIFRDALFEAYDGACAFCGLTFYESLDAAHIHPWALCAEKDRINPRNGILLCANHHRMFDIGNLAVTPDFRIEYADPEKKDGPYSFMDDSMSAALHGKAMRLPVKPKLRPDTLLISARRAQDEAD